MLEQASESPYCGSLGINPQLLDPREFGEGAGTGSGENRKSLKALGEVTL